MGSLQWLLDRRDFGLRLVVGDVSDRPLSWAHAIDAIDPTPWLSGGELVLTTGLRLPGSAAEQSAYVERLAAAGVAGLGFGVGVRFDDIPPMIVEAARRYGLPLLEVPLETAFIAITQAVGQSLTEQRVEALQRVLDYQRDITRAAVRDGLRGAVVRLARELECDVVALDEYGVVMAASTRQGDLLTRIDEEYRRLSTAGRLGATAVETDEGTLELQMIQGRSGVCGWLAIQHRRPASHTDRMLLNQAAGLITLQLDWPTELIAAYHDLGGTLLSLLLDAGGTASGLERHLHHFGFEPRDEVVLAVAISDRRHARLEQVIAANLEASKRPHVVTRIASGVAMLLLERDAERLLVDLEQVVRDAGLTGVDFGVSGALDQFAIGSGLGPAELAADAARRTGQRIGWFRDLALGPVLTDGAVRSRIRSVAHPALTSLTNAKGRGEEELVESLKSFLHHNGSWEPASRSLGIHRHTLKARMARVEQLTGLSLDVAEHRALLLLALLSDSYDQ